MVSLIRQKNFFSSPNKNRQIASCAFLLYFLISLPCFSQTGPGGVGTTDGSSTLNAWWKADIGVTSSAGAVSLWADQSGHGHNLSQATAGNRPTTTTSAALNNKPIIRYTGASSKFFSSSFSGPGGDNITLFLVANGTSYQSLIRFQTTGSPFVVYPWDMGGGTFISSSDGSTGGGVASGLVAGVNNVGGARYRRNTTNGMQTFLNGGINAQRNSINAALPNEPFFSGKYNEGSEFPTADVGEMIVYYSALNDAQMIIVQNYLAAKYNVTLTSNDVYTMDNAGNGDYDFDVAGIGRVDASNLHTDAQGSSMVRILSPSQLGDNEFLFWGDNGFTKTALTTSDVPADVVSRLSRVWRANEANVSGTAVDVGTINIRFDLTGFSGITTADLRLLVDTDNDNSFADETPISGATVVSGSIYQFTGVSQIANGLRFTLSTDIVNTFYSFASGAWESNTVWSLSSDGSTGALPAGVFPGRGDNVVIRTGHTITANNVADNGYPGVKPDDLGKANIGPFGASNLPMFYHTGNILIDGTLNISGVEAMLGGYTHILSGGILTTGSNLVVTGNLEADNGSALSTLDDIILTGNSVTIINTTSTSSDDFIIDHTDATLCGTGSTVLQNGAGSAITYANGGTLNQVCTSFTIACTGAGCAGTFPTVGTTEVILGNTGPGGIGSTDGTSQLKLWFRPDNGIATTSSRVDSWSNSAGIPALDVSESGTERPTLVTNAVNGFSEISFDGNNRLRTGLTLTPSNFITSAASSFTVVRADNTAQNSSVYVTDPLDVNRFSNHVPWAATVYYDIGTCCGTTSRLEVSGLSGLTNYSLWSYTAEATAGKTLYRNGTSLVNVAGISTFTSHASYRFNLGGHSSGVGGFEGDVAEVAIYNTGVNDAQRIIIDNYLTAKYGLALTANDVYTYDNVANNYDVDVAGIGKAANGSYHRDSKGTGIVRMWNSQDLGVGEFLLWGHNNATLTTTTTAAGTSVDGTVIKERLTRIWGVTETGDVGMISVSFDLGAFPPTFVGSNLRLLIDRDGDGFQDNDVTPITGSFISNTVVFNVNLNTGDRFTLGNTSSAAPLPIELVDFEASANENTVVVKWKTVTEVNNDYFQVYRSADAEHWHDVTRVRGAGNSTRPLSYQIVDHHPLSGKNYYRLKQTDYDGHSSYSEIVAVVVSLIDEITVSPNPSTGVFSITHVDIAHDYIRIFDMLSHEIPYTMVNDGELKLNIAAQPPGVYIIQIFRSDSVKSFRIVKN